LPKWLQEIFNRGDQRDSNGGDTSSEDFDPEQFMGSTHPPILVIGTKVENCASTSPEGSLPTRTPTPRGSSIAQECGAEEIFLVLFVSK